MLCFIKKLKDTQFNFHQFLKYTTYNLKKIKYFYIIYIYIYIYIIKKISKFWGGHSPSMLLRRSVPVEMHSCEELVGRT